MIKTKLAILVVVMFTLSFAQSTYCFSSEQATQNSHNHRWKKPPESFGSQTEVDLSHRVDNDIDMSSIPYAELVQLGNDYFDNDQYHEAIETYIEALDFNPTDTAVLADLGVMYRRVGDFHQALSCFDKALAINPENAITLFNKGVVLYYDIGKKDEALQCWRAVLQLQPEFRINDRRLLRELIEQIN